MKLYYSPAACSLAPHIALIETGAAFTAEKVGRDKKTASGADFLAINPKGYVPALELDDGDLLTEGVVMQQYIADLKPEAGLAPARGTKERLKLEELLVFLSTEVHKNFSPLFAPATPDDYKTQVKEKIAQRFDYLEKQLSDGRAFLTGSQFTIADAYFFTLSNWAKFTGIDLARWPNIAAFAGRVAQRPSVQQAMKAEGLL
ncbi:MAG: glutathione transferase GstA [Hyphomonadaceae bacterium]|nr:glutathione transferase GstA [Hyphomonadaceae bacterium]